MQGISRIKLFFAPLFILLCFAAEGYSQTCTGGHVDLKACGAVGDDAANDSPALQAALEALAAAGGGTLSVPEGRYRLASPVGKNFQNLAASIIIRGLGSATVFHFASGPGTTNIMIAGTESLLVENLVFAGTPGLTADAKVAFAVNSNEKTTFRRTDWYGVATTEAGGAVLRAQQTDLLVENSSFRGCAGYFPNHVPVVLATHWFSTKFADTDFIDYGTLHGVFHSKTGQGSLSWVYLTNPNEEKEARAVFSRMFLDEGAFIGLYTETVPRAIVHFEHIGMNVNSSTLGFGIRVVGASRASVSDSWFGYAAFEQRNAIEFFNVETATVERVVLRDKANRIFADSLTKSLTISDSNFDTLDADAASITLKDSNITNLQLSASSKLMTRSGAALTASSLALGGGAVLNTTSQTGTGSLVMSNAPTLAGATLTNPTISNPNVTGLTLTNPNIGAATATSLAIGGGTPLTTTNRTGTGNLVLASAPTLTGATLTNPTITGASLSGATLTSPNLGAATGTSLSLGGGTPLTTTNRTGTGNLVLSNAPTLASPVFTTPTLGAATGTSLSLGGGTPLTTTNRTGTGNLVLASAPTLTGATLTSPTITGASLTNATLVTPNIGAATGLSLALGGGTPLTTTNRTGTGNLVLSNAPTLASPVFTTPTLGAATATSLSIGGGTPLVTTNRTGTGNLVLSEAPTLTGATLANPTITGASLTGATLVTPNIGAATGTSLSLGGGTPLATTNRTGTGSLVMSNAPTLAGATLTSPSISNASVSNATITGASISGASISGVTLTSPNIGAAAGLSLALGGGTPLTTTNQTGTGSLVLSNAPNISAPFLAGRVSRTVLDLAPGAADPSVAGGDVFRVANTLPTMVTSLRDGADGQLIILVFTDANTTVVDGPDIRLRGDFSAKPDAVLILIRVGAAWFEISRSIDAKPMLPSKTALPLVLAPKTEAKSDKTQSTAKPEDK